MSKNTWCNYCKSYGHHVRKCPTLRADAASGHWRAKRKIDDWAYADAQRKAKIAAGDFRCSYCGEKGHRRSKCPKLAEDKATFVKILNEYRKGRELVLDSYGLGQGAMFVAEHKNWRQETVDRDNMVSLGWIENTIHPFSRKAKLAAYLPKTGKKVELELPNPLQLKSLYDHPLKSAKLGYTNLHLVCDVPRRSVFSDNFCTSTEKSKFVKELFASKSKHKIEWPRWYGDSRSLSRLQLNCFNTSYLRGDFA